LAGIYYAVDEYEKAIVEYKSAIELDKDDKSRAIDFNGLGSVYFRQSHHEDAIAAYQKAIELDPKFAYPWNGLGNVYRDLGRTDEAEAAYRKAIELDPKYAAPWNGLGNVYSRLEQYDKALQAREKAVGLKPDDGAFRASLAGLLRKMGHEQEAQKEIEIARPFIEGESEYNRACFESICGNIEEALRLLKITIEKNPGDRILARRDPDFDFIREDPRFKELVGEG
jgi:tetratricopeptide (TPR) repeat protein